MTTKILVIEDQEDINTLIALNLRLLDFHISTAMNGEQGYQQALTGQFDLIILDIMLPDKSGLEICKALRAQGIYTPILMLTAKKSETDRVMGLEAGADDYLTKPFSVLELQARVKALLRRVAFEKREIASSSSNTDSTNEITLGALRVNKSNRTLNINNTPISLTAKEFDLFLYLVNSPGQVFSREQLLNAVWGYHHAGYEHTVNSHINRLRSKLENDSSNPEYVLTVWGIGYKFNQAIA